MPNAFEENSEIPSEEFRAKFNKAVTLLDSRRLAYERLHNAQQFADWVAFALTGLITVTAGYLGRLRFVTSGATPSPKRVPETEVSHETVATVPGVDDSIGRVSRRPRRLAAVIGLMAALASTSTALSNRLEVQAEKRLKQAIDLNQNLSSIRIEWYAGKTKEDALRVLGKLDQYMLSD